MVNPKLFLAVDLGTSFIKTGVYGLDGTCRAEASEAVQAERPGPGMFVQRGEGLYQAMLRCIAKTTAQLLGDAAAICAIAFTGQMAGAMGVDRDWNDITGWSCSLDTRYLPYAQQQRQRYADDVFRIGGTSAPVMCAKYQWFRSEFPQLHERIAKYVMLNGYMIGKLSGQPVDAAKIDTTLIGWTGMADIRQSAWSAQLCGAMGIDPAHLPQIAESTEIGGYLEETTARALGLRPGIALVVGAGDKICGCVGSGVLQTGDMIFEASSYGAVSCRVDQVRLDTDRRNYDVIGSFDRGGYYAHKYIQGSGIAIDWFMNAFVRQADEPLSDAFRRAEALAAQVPAGSGNMLAIGLLTGSAMPFDSEIRGMFLGHTLHHGKGHFYRALLEGYCYDLALTIRSMHRQYPQCADAAIRLIGGGARSAVWPQMLADVTGHRFVRTDRRDAALWGAALLAAAATGAIGDIGEAAAGAVGAQEIFLPNHAATEAYGPYIGLYDESLSLLHALYGKLNRI